MENLLCDEVWLSTPLGHNHDERETWVFNGHCHSFFTSKEDSEHAILLCREKECSYMPEPDYLDYLQSNNLVFARSRAIGWLFKTCNRLNLSIATVFNAANYLDRFLSMSQCHGWKHWMFELVSVACFSIASKMNETFLPSLDELQMEDLDHCFESSTIRQMELILLKALKWRLGSTTTYSYIELFTSNIIHLKYNLHKDYLIDQVTKMLVRAILDIKLLHYPPSVIAVSALWCSLEQLIPSSFDLPLTNIMKLINQDHEDDITTCRWIMKAAWLADPFCGFKAFDQQSYNYPSSPVTVLLMEINDCKVDLSLFKMPATAAANSNVNILESRGIKRKRED